jgi:hypothetical protein
MTHGPVLSCFGCDEREDGSWGKTLCNAARPVAPRVLDDTGLTPDWCPLRALAIAALQAQPRAWNAHPNALCIEGPSGRRPLVSGDYGFDGERDD